MRHAGPWTFAVLCGLVLLANCSTTPDSAEKQTPAEAEIARLVESTEANPRDARAHYALGNAYFDAARYEEARAAYATSVEIQPDAADALTNLGLTQRVLGDVTGAIESYRRALAHAPDDVVTLQNLVVALQAEGRVAEAVGPLARLVQLHPSDLSLLNDYAATLVVLDRHADAARAYEAILTERPDDLTLRYTLGQCYFEERRWQEAIAEWRTVVAVDPDFPQAHSGLAAAYVEVGDYTRAWSAVRDCQRLGAYIDPELVTRLQNASGQLGPE